MCNLPLIVNELGCLYDVSCLTWKLKQANTSSGSLETRAQRLLSKVGSVTASKHSKDHVGNMMIDTGLE